MVDLDDLKEGVNYFTALGYRVRRWVSYHQNMVDLKKSVGRAKEQCIRPSTSAIDSQHDRVIGRASLDQAGQIRGAQKRQIRGDN